MFGFIPHNEAKQTIFTASGWQAWTKPVGISHVAFTIIGAGGGGGRASNVINQGAGGGGSGGVTQILMPSIILPDTVYVWVGAGGPGGVSNGTDGTAGVGSYVSIYHSALSASILGYANGGGGGAAALTAGTAAAIADISIMPLAAGYYYILQAGLAGANAGANITLGALCLSGGAGGSSGSGTAGGNITGSGLIPTISGGPAGSGEGGSGVWFWKGFKGCGGSGGGSSSSSVVAGGRGGNGAYGCGGGGGGASSDAFGISGNGGNGGQGLVVVHYW